MSASVTVAIPVRNGGALLRGVLVALARQTLAHELLVCDSGSDDGSVELVRAYGARVIEIDPADFGHGRTRNLLVRESGGDYVAFLTQDAEPAGEFWLQSLISGFSAGADVALSYGPYLARPDAPAAVRIELMRWFESLAPDGQPRLDRLEPEERPAARRLLVGRRGFFTDANACLAKSAWEEVPFRDSIPYAEDRALALDMLLAGYSKCYVPGAAVLHSHHYGPREQLRRSFDEARALEEVYGWRERSGARSVLRRVRGELGVARRTLSGEGAGVAMRVATLAAVARQQLMRVAGSELAARAETLPSSWRARLSLEGRAGGDAPVVRSDDGGR